MPKAQGRYWRAKLIASAASVLAVMGGAGALAASRPAPEAAPEAADTLAAASMQAPASAVAPCPQN